MFKKNREAGGFRFMAIGTDKETLFICPICGAKLYAKGKSLTCEKMHCFDIAKSGYVNLMPTSHGSHSAVSGKSGHGDNKKMIAARRLFLDGGYYENLRESVCEILLSCLPQHPAILDAGCGEGYYTEKMYEKIPNSEIYGIDISKDALSILKGRPAIAAHLDIPRAAVASVYHLPFADSSFDGITSIFSPYAHDEFIRTLKGGGYMIRVIPSRRHLFELKAAIYDTPYENEIQPYQIDRFEFIGKKELSYRITLPSHELIDALFQMTPYYYRTSDSDRERISALESLETEAGFEILIYRKID